MMGESVGVSVSFGKYENDAALCWEKWSTFSPNKYLEEVGKCSTPGSVAQKKAFFEAHYKKIAAMKAEADLLDATDSTSSDHHTFQDVKQPQISAIKLQQESFHNMQGGDVLEPPITLEEEAVLVNNESMKQHFQVGDVLPSQSPITLNSSSADKLQEEAVLVNNESIMKQHFHVDLETQDPREISQEIPKQKAQNMTQKINPNRVEKNSIGMKKKPASLIPKSPETPGSRLSKPKPKPNSASSMKKPSAPLSSSKNKYHSVSETRRFTPVSLHLSMSMSSINSDTASSVTSSRRRSLFMEQMGDKDIVRRAFKTFQNGVNQLPSYDTGPKQLPTKKSEQKTSTSGAYQKENERSRKAAEKINPERGQLGPTWKSVSSASLKEVGVDERQLKAGPTSLALKSNERAERRKEFFKNLEEKSNAREAERSQLSLKSKEVKGAEMKRLKQNLNYKAKRVPNFSQPQGALKNTSDKETIKTGTTR